MNKGQKQIDDLFKKLDWSYWTHHEIMLSLTEEVGELARLVNHEYGPKPKKSSERDQEFEAEMGDVLYSLICIANKQGVDLDVALNKCIKKCETRDKDRF